ncbi:MAG: Uma2 family endonuclease [Gemmatales bacterium]|nr:Uma2 family endonuclease [Gemmatales bacterium]MDW7993737.1 Uma2 family endonuclease [Gemmatales bacterium]
MTTLPRSDSLVPLQQATGRLLTAEEFWQLRQQPQFADQLLELDEGELVIMPLGNRLHGAICAVITALLLDYARRQKRGYVCSNDTCLLLSRNPDIIRGPDIMYFLEPPSEAELSDPWCEKVPALIVEVLSPTDQPHDIQHPVEQYLHAGVHRVWLVDPQAKQVRVHRRGTDVQVLSESDTLTGDEVLPGFACVVADLFRLPGD